MKCPKCNNFSPDNVRFCQHCGSPLIKVQTKEEGHHEKKKHKRRYVIWWAVGLMFCVPFFIAIITSEPRQAPLQNEEVPLSEENSNSMPEPESGDVIIPETENVEELSELTDAERLGVSETELSVLEDAMRMADWDYTRKDFERVYRLTDDEMAMNPANYAEYEVTIRDGKTHTITVKRNLVDRG